MKKKNFFWLWIIPLLFVFGAGCAGIPVRETVKVDLSLPAGKIEGNQFTGIRYPFKVSAPPGWQMASKHPAFMIDLGYEKEGMEESEVFIYNPATQSNFQIDFTPAGRYSTFDQEKIEWLTTIATGSLEDELKKDYGEGIQIKVAPTKPYLLKGVPFAAKKYVTYAIKGIKREQGWVYAFSEPYQIFILYMVLEKEGKNDYGAIKEILDSFEYIPK
jgi:hypothetical protein